jgi:hypothetical protein
MDSDTLREGTNSEKLGGSGATKLDSGDAATFDHGISVKTVALVEEGHVDPLYQAKAQLLNDAIQEIGMGRYQWHLFVVAGFGWFSDNVPHPREMMSR